MSTIDDPQGGLAGAKAKWQNYPCITEFSQDHVLIAESEDFGRIVDANGNIVDEGKPYNLSCNHHELHLKTVCPRCIAINEKATWWDFWQSKYPDLLPDRNR